MLTERYRQPLRHPVYVTPGDQLNVTPRDPISGQEYKFTESIERRMVIDTIVVFDVSDLGVDGVGAAFCGISVDSMDQNWLVEHDCFQ